MPIVVGITRDKAWPPTSATAPPTSIAGTARFEMAIFYIVIMFLQDTSWVGCWVSAARAPPPCSGLAQRYISERVAAHDERA